MKHSVLKRNFILIVISTIIVNTILIFTWYNFRITPEITQNNKLEKAIKLELKNNYQNMDEFTKKLSSLTNNYKIDFTIKNENNDVVYQNKKNTKNIFVFAYNTKVNDKVYTITAYNHKDISLDKLTLKLILFQIIIISIIMIFAYIFTGIKVIKPVNKIITDIKNYKFGKKPIKCKITNELDLIQNEFVNLTTSLENEKVEQNRIIASISHDIKTPLTSILGYADLALDKNTTKEEMKKYNLKIKEKSIHIKNILSTFDDYLINYDNQKLKLDTIKIKDIAKELNDDYKIELENKNIQFNVKTKIGEEIITIDILKLKRIFSNIITNSIRYVPKGNGKIDINIKSDKQNIKFIISDNGSGIEQNKLEKIFDPFFTTDESRKISGLGLSICKEFTLMHQGEIKAYNNNGLTIEFTLPKNLNNS